MQNTHLELNYKSAPRRTACGLRSVLLAACMLLLSSVLNAADNPLPPDGDPLPTTRDDKHEAYGCPGDDYIRVSELPISVTQSCLGTLNYQVLSRPEGDICGRKGRKQFRDCIRRKVSQCIEMSVMQERRVPMNYCRKK